MSDPTLFDEAPAYKRARPDQPETALEAAEANRAQRGRIRQRVADMLRRHGDMTDDELLAACRDLTSDRSSVAKRRGELMADGWVADTGRRRPNSNGRNVAVWTWLHTQRVPEPEPEPERCPTCGQEVRQ